MALDVVAARVGMIWSLDGVIGWGWGWGTVCHMGGRNRLLMWDSPSPLIPLPSRRPLQNLPSFPRRRESIVKTQLEELRI